MLAVSVTKLDFQVCNAKNIFRNAHHVNQDRYAPKKWHHEGKNFENKII